MKKQKKPATVAVELRLPDDLMATLAHASVLSGQPVEAIINTILALRVAADRRPGSAAGGQS